MHFRFGFGHNSNCSGRVRSELASYAQHRKPNTGLAVRSGQVEDCTSLSCTFTTSTLSLLLCRFIAKGQNDQENDFAIHSTYLIVTSGILGGQHTLQERGIRNETDFKGTITFAGRSNGMESAAGKADANGKVPRSRP